MSLPTEKPLSSAQDDFRSVLANNRLAGLWRMLRGYRLPYFAAALSLGIAASAKTAGYLLLRYFADDVLQVGNASQEAAPLPAPLSALAVVAGGFVALALIEGGFTYLSGRLAAFTAEGITRRLRNFLFDHIQRLSFSYYSQTSTGELIQRSTSDVDALRRFFSDQAINVGRIVILFAINFTAVLLLNVKLAFLSILAIPALLFFSVFFFKRVSKAYEAFQEQEAALSTTLQENLSGVRVVKAFARQQYEREKFERDNWEKFLRGRRLLLMHATFWPLSDILCGFQMLGGFFAAAWMAINQEISVGGYLAYHGFVIQLIWPMRNLGRLIVDASSGLVSYTRVMEIVKQEREPLAEGELQPQADLRGDIRFDRVSFGYEQDAPVLTDVSFHAPAGKVVALLGSTGSGKTTLVNLLPRFFEYTSGCIELDGRPLTEYPRQYLRRQIGIVEQEPFLFSRSIRENITYGVGRETPFAEVETAARSAAIHEVILTFPNGYDTLVGERGVTLSGGQRQRVAIARTLLKNPRILILDDSTSSVDTETEVSIREALERLMQNRTTFIIAHRIQSVMNADWVLVLDRGRVVQQGVHADLLGDVNGMYRRIYDIQTRIETELEREIAQAGV